MPISKQAKKKQRHDDKVKKHLAIVRQTVRTSIKSVRAKPTKKSLSLAFKTLDKAIKVNVVHKNKVARLKSRLSKLVK